MKTTKIKFFILFFLLIATAFFYYLYAIKSKASGSELNIKIKLQGDFQKTENLKIISQFQILDPNRRIKLNNEYLYQSNSNFFISKLSLFGLQLPQIYSVFIKPKNYFGRYFSALPLINGQNSFDFSNDYFYYGDIDGDGRISAQDLSLIFRDLGKNYYTSHYMMALFALKNNFSDDQIITATPSPTFASAPSPLTPTIQSNPTSTLIPTSTAAPTLISPSHTQTPPPAVTLTSVAPSPTPFLTPTPTLTQNLTPSPSQRSINKEKIIDLIRVPQLVSCVGNPNCNKNELYHTSLNQGIGFATYYGNESNPNNNIVAIVIGNRMNITYEQARRFIADHFTPSQLNLDPEAARVSGKVIAFGATRSCADLWKIKYLFVIDNPTRPDPYFIGRVMIIDCAARQDWENHLSTVSYSFKGWNRLPWIIDLSRNGFIQLPTGLSGNPNNIGEGRPGVVAIDESLLGEFYR
jgi:hypothetical protein